MFNKEVVTIKQGIILISMLITGTSIIYSLGIETKQDFWLAILLSIALSIPFAAILGRLHSVFPGKDLFEINELCFGKYLGKVISLLFIYYFFVNTSEILRNFGQFVTTVSLSATPMLLIFIAMMLLVVWAVKQGVEVITRVSGFIFIIIIVSFFIVILLLTPAMNPINLLPILSKGVKPLFAAALSIVTFPFCEIIVFAGFFNKFTGKKSFYKLYIFGLLLGGVLIFCISLTNVLVLGTDIVSLVLYPTYTTFTRINLGNTLQRLDIVLASLFLFSAFVKIAVYLLVVCRGITRIFGFKDYRFIVTLMAILIVIAAYSNYQGKFEYFEFAFKIWPFYAIIEQIVLIVLIFIVAEIKKGHLRKIQA